MKGFTTLKVRDWNPDCCMGTTRDVAPDNVRQWAEMIARSFAAGNTHDADLCLVEVVVEINLRHLSHPQEVEAPKPKKGTKR